jgi:hypothetical protein
MPTVKTIVKKQVKKVVKAPLIQETDQDLQELREDLPERYYAYLDELAPEDQGIYLRHKDNYRTAAKDFLADVQLALDLNRRMNEFYSEENIREETYGKKLIKNLSILLQVSEGRIYSAMKFVSLFGEIEAMSIARTIDQEKLSITLTHFRQLNRLSSDDFKETRKEILQELYDGKLVTVKDVEARVDAILGVTRQEVSVINPVAQTSPGTDYEVAEDEPYELDKPKSKSESCSDEEEYEQESDRSQSKSIRPCVPGLGSLSSSSSLNDILSFVILSGVAQTKQWDDLYNKIDQWRADMDLDTLKDVDASVGVKAVNELRNTCNTIKNVLATIEEICMVITTTQQEAPPSHRKVVTPRLAEVA